MSVHFKIERGKHMKNSLGALNEYLFMQLDALSNQDLKGEELKEEMEACMWRSKGEVCPLLNMRFNL